MEGREKQIGRLTGTTQHAGLVTISSSSLQVGTERRLDSPCLWDLEDSRLCAFRRWNCSVKENMLNPPVPSAVRKLDLRVVAGDQGERNLLTSDVRQLSNEEAGCFHTSLRRVVWLCPWAKGLARKKSLTIPKDVTSWCRTFCLHLLKDMMWLYQSLKNT